MKRFILATSLVVSALFLQAPSYSRDVIEVAPKTQCPTGTKIIGVPGSGYCQIFNLNLFKTSDFYLESQEVSECAKVANYYSQVNWPHKSVTVAAWFTTNPDCKEDFERANGNQVVDC